mgnify:FL=1
MRVKTRYFGEVDIEDTKVIHFEKGIPGFEQYTDYTILYDIEEGQEAFFSWLQCITEEGLAFPIVNPFRVDTSYDPVVEDALLKQLINGSILSRLLQSRTKNTSYFLSSGVFFILSIFLR